MVIEFNWTNKELFRYFQLKSWITDNFEPLSSSSDPPAIQRLFLNPDENKKWIGKVYKHLVEVQENNYSLQKIYEGWNKDLNITNSDSIWKQCLSTTNTITTNENLRLIQYKLMTRIYYTRSKINTFDASFSPVCVKCGIYKETIIHAFWECEKVRKGWLEIKKGWPLLVESNLNSQSWDVFSKIQIHLNIPLDGWSYFPLWCVKS